MASPVTGAPHDTLSLRHKLAVLPQAAHARGVPPAVCGVTSVPCSSYCSSRRADCSLISQNSPYSASPARSLLPALGSASTPGSIAGACARARADDCVIATREVQLQKLDDKVGTNEVVFRGGRVQPPTACIRQLSGWCGAWPQAMPVPAASGMAVGGDVCSGIESTGMVPRERDRRGPGTAASFSQ